MSTLNLGRVGFVNKGIWLISTAYKINDTVTYLGGTYACLIANAGQTPVLGGTIYWQEWAANNSVHKTTDETIGGIKTFISSPIVPIATLSNQAMSYGQERSPYRNRFINGANNVSQINADAAVTVTAGASLQYVIDQWYAYCTGANVTGQRIAGSLQSKYRYRYTGAASVTKIGHAQRMEAINTYDMNGQTTMVGVDMSNSLLTTVSWSAWYANTTDTFGTLASPTRTLISSGTITVSSTIERHYIPISIPSAATTGIEIEFSVGAQISGTWVIGNAQFEKVTTGATQGTGYEWLSYGEEERICQRYFQYVGKGILTTTPSTTVLGLSLPFPTVMRSIPIITIIAGSGTNALFQFNGGAVTIASYASTSATNKSAWAQTGGTFVANAQYTCVNDVLALSAVL